MVREGAADRGDADHDACLLLLEEDEGPLVTTALVIAEAAYLIDRQLGPDAETAHGPGGRYRWGGAT